MSADLPRTTIAVIERDSYSATGAMLARLVEHSASPRRIVVFDSGARGRARRRIERLTADQDITLVRSDSVLTANEERNLALEHVHTEFVAFIDNDSMVPPNWLDDLERCADDTGAAAVLPAFTWGPPGAIELHYAGGTTRLVGDGGHRRVEEVDTLMHRPVGDLALLERCQTTIIELHCVLARTEVIRGIAPFDESLIAARDTTDLALRLMTTGAAVFLEPRVVVHYLWPRRLAPSDYPFFLARWSDQWGERSYASFNRTWRLDDTAIDDVFRRGHRERRLQRYGPWPDGWRGRVARTRFRIRRKIDAVATPLAVRALDRQRARARAPYVVHTASWDTAHAAASHP